MGHNWRKLLLLSWKNWRLQVRRPVQTVIEILTPVLFCVVLVYLRGKADLVHMKDMHFRNFELNSSELLLEGSSLLNTIYWSPCANPVLDQLMSRIADGLGMNQTCFANGKALDAQLPKLSETSYVGIEFDDSLVGRTTLLKDMHVIIRFPGKLRNSGERSWNTHRFFEVYQHAGPRAPHDPYGGLPYYFHGGFLSVQFYIAKGIIASYSDEELPHIYMQRFSYPAWDVDPFLDTLPFYLSFLLMLGFIYTCINTVKVITTEKENQLKEAMKIVGLSSWLHWTAWFLKIFFFLLIAVILMLILLKTPWYPDSSLSVFTLADPFILFLFLVCYVCATITFCFAISVFFSSANAAATIAGLSWFFCYFPYSFSQHKYAELTLQYKLISSLCCNSAMGYGVQIIVMFEGKGEGVKWSNIFKPVSPDDSLSLGLVMVMLLIDALLFLLVALYVEAVFPGDYGVPQKWYFPFTRSFWCGKPKYLGAKGVNEQNILESDVYEKEPSGIPVGIRISHLTKQYGKHNVAVGDLSLNMFEGQITVLLGHNGAGKTTTMSVLTGMLQPTSGTAVINGYDIRNNMHMVRGSLGWCPQHNILFDDLTVREHLYFFSKLKGMRGREIKAEIDKYVELLDLVPKKKSKAKTLSGGMKRKLCVAIALCGKTKVCMFDEPTAGMDPAARRALWDVMQSEKKGRTILLSTHYMDEADLLGDRIAIMAGGKLQCCGSSFFLKKKYSSGYHLVIAKSEGCDVPKVTSFIQKHIPNVKVERNVGTELTYVLANEQSFMFERLFYDLEGNTRRLGIESYGISLSTMEEVFMKVGADHGQDEDDKVYYKRNGNENTNSKLSESKLDVKEKKLLTGCALWRNQLLAMLIKHALSTLRIWLLVLIINIIPVLFVIIAVMICRQKDISSQVLPKLDMTLDSYENPITIITRLTENDSVYKQYLQILKRENRDYDVCDGTEMTDNLMNKTKENTLLVRTRYIIGAQFVGDDGPIIAWFNAQSFHASPLALQYAINALVKSKLGSNYSITYSNFPLPYKRQEKKELTPNSVIGFDLASNIAFGMSFVSPFFLLFYIKERVKKSKHLQFVSGAKVSSYWLVAFTWDYLTFLFIALWIIVILTCFPEDTQFKPASTVLGWTYILLMVFGFSMLPLMYLASFLFNVASSGYTRMALISILLGNTAFVVTHMLERMSDKLKDVSDSLERIFLVYPHYALATGIYKIADVSNKKLYCIKKSEESDGFINNPVLPSTMAISKACLKDPGVCCDIKEMLDWDKGMTKSLVYMVAVGVVLFMILLLHEYGFFEGIRYICKRKKQTIHKTEGTEKGTVLEEGEEDDDVLEEKYKIRDGIISQKHYNVLLKDMTKYYGKFLAVNQICLGIREYECFGLLGTNGAGKTTTFKMMTGDERISYGDGWVNGMNLKKNMRNVRKHIGYCPQFDALLDNLTGKETLIMYCLLRGIRLNESSRVAEKLAKEFDFYHHYNKRVKNYSGGNKRKLSAALALIGDPPIIFLDEPTAGKLMLSLLGVISVVFLYNI